jgi:hypothetical protein
LVKILDGGDGIPHSYCTTSSFLFRGDAVFFTICLFSGKTLSVYTEFQTQSKLFGANSKAVIIGLSRASSLKMKTQGYRTKPDKVGKEKGNLDSLFEKYSPSCGENLLSIQSTKVHSVNNKMSSVIQLSVVSYQ